MGRDCSSTSTTVARASLGGRVGQGSLFVFNGVPLSGNLSRLQDLPLARFRQRAVDPWGGRDRNRPAPPSRTSLERQPRAALSPLAPLYPAKRPSERATPPTALLLQSLPAWLSFLCPGMRDDDRSVWSQPCPSLQVSPAPRSGTLVEGVLDSTHNWAAVSHGSLIRSRS